MFYNILTFALILWVYLHVEKLSFFSRKGVIMTNFKLNILIILNIFLFSNDSDLSQLQVQEEEVIKGTRIKITMLTKEWQD